MMTTRRGRLRRRLLPILAVVPLVVSGCANGSGDSDSDAARTLHYHGGTFEVETIDPAKWYVIPLAYDVLIDRAPDGSLNPMLAESWQYVGEDNTVFEMTLRPDVSFGDGEPLNAEAVQANLEYRLDPATGAAHAAELSAISEIEIIDDLTVRLHLSDPNPLLPELFSKNPGAMISPAALVEPERLATETHGVGPYTLDSDATVYGERYTFVSDPNYWNPDAAHWDEVVVHYLPEESSAIASLQSGQLDAAIVNYQAVQAGVDAGLSVAGPGRPIVLGLSLVDREGEVVPALADQRVRQALNYAVDRGKIVTALVGESGEATDQLSAPGQDGWNEEGIYSHDLGRAEQLLAEAGWEDGFTLPVRVPRTEELLRMAQAIGDQLSAVGVELEIDAVSGGQFDPADDETNREYGAVLLGWGVEPPFTMGESFWLPDASNNTFDSVDDTLVELHQELQAADEATRAEIDHQIVTRVAELGWFLPVAVHGQSVLYDAEKVQVPWTRFVTGGGDVVDQIRPAS